MRCEPAVTAIRRAGEPVAGTKRAAGAGFATCDPAARLELFAIVAGDRLTTS